MLLSMLAMMDEPSDRAFFESLYLQYRRLIYAVVKKYLSDDAGREDAIQDCLLRLMEKLTVLRSLEHHALTAYVAAAAKNCALNQLRRQQREAQELPDLDPPQGGRPVEELLLLWERRSMLGEVLSRLGQRSYLLLTGRYLLGLSDAELASQLGCTPASVRMALTRARREALALLEQAEPGRTGSIKSDRRK